MPKNLKLNFNHSTTKIKSLVEAISISIMQGDLGVGDNLLSINEASSYYKVSRDTIFKAYNELKRLGVIDSTPQKGYFVKDEVNRVLLLLDTYSPFKKDLYHRFAENLPENYKVDLIFHQYNENLFETILRESIGKYSMYVVMSFSNDKLSKTLKMIPTGKLLLLDFGNFEKSDLSYICQDFNQALYNCLKDGIDVIRKYQKLVFVFPEDLRHPISSIDFFKQFCKDNSFDYQILRKSIDWKGVENKCLYLCITTQDMVKVVKEVDKVGFKLGNEIGLIAYNDDPVLEIIRNGISTISIDFGLMGEKAAEFVKSKKLIQEYIPTKLIIRGSL
ncbi:MAG: GntR family transcriptional regulator [Paludibacter sp.]